MTTLWRISNHTDLTGAGGMRAPGRWHSVGHPIVYLSEHPASCLLEVLAHGLSVGEVPRAYQWLEVAVAAEVSSETVADLPDNWVQDVIVTRTLGDRWLRGRTSALLKVPSVLAPATVNYLLNPRHPQAAALRVTRTLSHPTDTRFGAGAPRAGKSKTRVKPTSTR